MQPEHAIALIRNNALVRDQATHWADLGCGTGLFTQALSYYLQPGSTVYAVDANRQALSKIKPPQGDVVLKKLQADFVQDALPLNNLDGLLMANSLHYVRDQADFLTRAQTWLKPEGCFLLVEYDTDRANPWVPYPLSFTALKQLFTQLGYRVVEKLGERPSVYRRAPIYAALACTR